MLDYKEALAEFALVVGEQYVASDRETSALLERATFATHQRVVAHVRPGTRDEIRECVAIARKFRIPLYPVSRGKNWGYGSRVPARSGCVVLDLGRLARILEVDEELAYAVVEPGVTFEQLRDHLRTIGSRLFLSVTGGAPDASVIGNALERGVGKGPYGDRFSSVCNFEIVLANGDVIETGFGRFGEASASHIARGSVGPFIDGLFAQSNFGIVTRMTVWLSVRPRNFQTFYFSIRTADKLSGLVDALRELRLSGVLRTPFLLANDLRKISFVAQYPWSLTDTTPLPAEILEQVKRERGVGAWVGDGALYSASPAHARAERTLVEEALGTAVDNLEFWDAERVEREGDQPSHLVASPRQAFEQSMYIGVPIRGSARMTYWRKRTPAPPPAEMDPDRDRCGVFWFSPALPARGRDACTVTRMVEETVSNHGYEANMGLNFITERCAYMTGAILFDRAIDGEDERAATCHRAVMKRLSEGGYFSYRLGIESMTTPSAHTSYDRFLAILRRAVDPTGIVAPGRYETSDG
jgi:4-cresol dehydrogenase (hydroxylating) flavoprotein subunit